MVSRRYTSLERTICTSAPFRTSTSFSQGFILDSRRSSPFGYRRSCCTSRISGLPRELPVSSKEPEGGHRKIGLGLLSLRRNWEGLSLPPARTNIELHDPCFQTGAGRRRWSRPLRGNGRYFSPDPGRSRATDFPCLSMAHPFRGVGRREELSRFRSPYPSCVRDLLVREFGCYFIPLVSRFYLTMDSHRGR